MKVGLGVLGFLGLAAVLFFAAVPTARVDAAIRGEEHVVNNNGYVFITDEVRQKSGLRIAVEGRLKWLGLL